jgi:hypothetical protein
MSITGQYVRQGAQPKLEKWTLEAEPYWMEITRRKVASLVTVTTPSGVLEREPFTALPSLSFSEVFDFLPLLLSKQVGEEDTLVAPGEPSRSDLEFLEKLGRWFFRSLGPRPYAFAPIRTHPQRTYDPLTDEPKPEGSHIPMVLARVSSSNAKAWEELRASLDSFGKFSGLFSHLEVRRMGQKESDPFQIRVRISGPRRNLVDVGYGVSQILPIIVDSLQRPEGSTFLLQQPEVHLHPKAQAELGSFLALIAKDYGKRFLIETHSDHLVDRIRMDIRDRDYLEPDNVQILYFERQDGGVVIQPLEVDHFGNIVNAPPGYRQFFLEEEKRLLLG